MCLFVPKEDTTRWKSLEQCKKCLSKNIERGFLFILSYVETKWGVSSQNEVKCKSHKVTNGTFFFPVYLCFFSALHYNSIIISAFTLNVKSFGK